MPFIYTVSGGLGGTYASAFASASALKLNVSANATRSGTGNAATCTGGTALVTDLTLTAGTGGTVVGTAQGPVATGGQGVAGGTQTIRITAALPAAAAWTSTPANQTVRFALLGSVRSCGAAS